MPELISIEIKGLDKLIKAFDKWPKEIRASMEKAGREAAEEVIQTEGLASYPPSTAANAPPYPYYERGKGTWTSPGHNLYNSEILGKKWTTKATGYNTIIGNTASYAKWLHDDKHQAKAMGRIGWRKLFEVAKEKVTKITRIYQKWVNQTIRRLGL